MHIDLYPTPHGAKADTQPSEDFLDLLRQQGFHPTKSLVEGSILCPVSAQSFDAFLEAIQRWTAQRPGRQVRPVELKIRQLQGEDLTLEITVHPTNAEAAGTTA
jgi:hypothetical protein